MFDYTISPSADRKAFLNTCVAIETHFSLAKEKPLIDVDGSAISIYKVGDKEIRVQLDYDVGAVYVISQIDLNAVLSYTNFTFKTL